MGTNTRAGVRQAMLRTATEAERGTGMRLIDGTSALSPVEQLEAELAEDRWDARRIPGLRYAPHRNTHYISFGSMPNLFRSKVKEYARFLLTAGRAAKTLAASVYYLG